MWSDRKRNQSSIIALAKLFKIDAVDLRTLLLHFVIKLYPQGRYCRSRKSVPDDIRLAKILQLSNITRHRKGMAIAYGPGAISTP